MTSNTPLQRANSKAIRRLLPILILLLFINYLDRVNVGFAAPTMNPDIGLTALTYGIGVAVFFIGYVLLEIPSNYVMYRVGARTWISRIAITWGLVAAAHALVTDFPTFAIARVLLGVAEAGLLPGILLYISLWFSGPQRILVLGIYYVAVPLSTAIGGPVSNWLIHHGSETFGLDGWRFMFAAEGLAATALGIVVIFLLPSRPRDARWLTDEEKQAMEGASDRASANHHGSRTFAAALRSVVTLRLAGIFLLLTFPMFAISFFLPLLTSAVDGGGEAAVNLVTFIPFTLGALASFGWSRFCQKRGLRPWHYALPAGIGGVGVLVCALGGTSFPVLLGGIIVAAVGIYAAIPVFWSFATGSLTGAAAAAGLALINTVGSLGGFIAGYFTGWLRDATGAYQVPLGVMAACLVVSAAIALVSLRRQPLTVTPDAVDARTEG
ncbi:MFS transporter [Schumannella luteola]|uniref:MFS family permease n=1 Tax=Schumannella luteola TaxID=472059 RepID=A0A852YKT8_9MICO|nr:MFS transporter [Schumannella luteola]NYG98349.1 MFS family permease [Schumannella luteola]TPX05770.1 MFS transporter [Schumannella luteola]